MYKKQYSLFSIMFLLTTFIGIESCKQNSKEQVIRIAIDEKEIKTNLLYSNLVEDVKFISLQTIDTSANANLWHISKVFFDDNLIFCLDRDVFGGIMIFDERGKHLNSIQIGRGSGKEITSISDAAIDKEKKEIRISNSPYIAVYSYKGEFLKRKKANFDSEHFEYTKGLSAFTSKEFGLIIKANNQSKEKTYLPSYAIHRQFLIQPFQVVDEGILFRHSLCDTIFLVKEQTVIPYRIIDFGDKKITQPELKAIIYGDQSLPVNPDKMHSIKYYSENKQFIHFTFQYKKKPLIALYNKLTKKTTVFPADKTINDVSFERFVPLIIGAKEDYFVATLGCKVPAIDTTKYTNNKYLKEFSKTFNGKNLTKGYNNPSLMLIKFKSLP